jgi:hypothetical protein
MFALPRGLVLGIALLTCITFLVEGALLDWGALLLTERGLFALEQAGSGYIVFSIAMTVARFSGDYVATRLGDQRTLLIGGVIALAGFAVLLTAATATLALAGFGRSVWPRQHRAGAVPPRRQPAGNAGRSGHRRHLHHGLCGHTGGAGLIGFIAQQVGLSHAFWLLAALLACAVFGALWLVRSRPAAVHNPAHTRRSSGDSMMQLIASKQGKNDKYDQLRCVRSDGSNDWLHDAAPGVLPHDLIHYVVETALAYRHGFSAWWRPVRTSATRWSRATPTTIRRWRTRPFMRKPSSKACRRRERSLRSGHVRRWTGKRLRHAWLRCARAGERRWCCGAV